MKIENQVCTLEQAKRLKELGVGQVSAFRYIETEELRYKFDLSGLPKSVRENMQAAFTVSELGVMLPEAEFDSGSVTNKHIDLDGKFYCSYDSGSMGISEKTIYKETEAEARAAMLIYLLENNIINADEVNERLI